MAPLLAVVALMLSVALPAAAQPARVIEGDSLELADQTVRLIGIDAPEGQQLCNATAGTGLAVTRQQ